MQKNVSINSKKNPLCLTFKIENGSSTHIWAKPGEEIPITSILDKDYEQVIITSNKYLREFSRNKQ